MVLNIFSAQFVKKNVLESREIKKATVILSLSECHRNGETVLHSFGAPTFLLFFKLSLRQSVVSHHPDEFWLSICFLSSGQHPVPDPFRRLNHQTS
ncbi:hypothetical protein P2G85_09880 [Vibrio sp. CAU 1672]|nr:hypothetical protein [Vibrio sp. CAU 1672]